ncbi:hypothetical protein PENTCL1PPCAC_12330 [Pristionchus entomophagus]|uniref:Uncharacterized protein n=1 Tax=Pristionchus entomophagus TaxID=358040 RepID=A0AAV5T3T3_9BILA|nr:hypothetical protein PENTCL1PPCAC_12330 [Pristionchus entomophagus]
MESKCLNHSPVCLLVKSGSDTCLTIATTCIRVPKMVIRFKLQLAMSDQSLRLKVRCWYSLSSVFFVCVELRFFFLFEVSSCAKTIHRYHSLEDYRSLLHGTKLSTTGNECVHALRQEW